MKTKKYLLALSVVIMCVGQVFAKGESTYYAKLKAESSDVTKGLVYANTSTTDVAKTSYVSSKTTGNASVKTSSNPASVSLYAWAQPVRGKIFNGWTTSGATVKTSPATGVADEITVSSSVTNNDNTAPTGTVTATWTDDEQYVITLNKPKCGSVTVKATYYAIASNKLKESSSSKTIYSTDSKDTIQFTAYKADKITLSAKEGNDGSSFVAWYEIVGEDTTFITYDREIIGYYNSAHTYYALIAPANESNFRICKKGDASTSAGFPRDFYNDLPSAIAAAQASDDKKVVALVKEKYTLTEDCTIPSDITLLIPFDNALSCYTTEPVILHGWRTEDDKGQTASATDPSTDQSFVYRTLTLASGAKLNIEGIVSLSAKRWCVINTGYNKNNGTYSNANPSGSNRIHKGFGLINMKEGSSIQVKSGGKLYCWGRIRGGGEITAKSGSEVRESYVYTDWRNNDYFGTYTRQTRCFPQNQYYIQDIQVPITYESGAICTLEGALFFSSGQPAQKGTMGFVGTSGSNSLFELPSDASMTKKYVASEDRIYIDLNNGASFNNFQLNYSSWKVKTSTHIFTITNNWTVNVNSGTTTVAYDLGWAPGSILNIKQGAAVTMLDGVSMYVYDHDDWGDFAAGRRIQALQKPKQEASYGVTVKTRTYDNDCPDAEIFVNGTLTVTGGENKVFKSTDPNCSFDISNKGTYQSGIYTTDGGANIHGKGIIAYVMGSGDQTKTQQLNLTTDWNTNTDSTKILYSSYPISKYGTGMARPTITPAKLKNGSGAQTEYTTTGLADGELNYPRKYTYSAETQTWEMEYIKKEVDPETEEEKTEVSGLHKEVVVTGDAEGETATATVTAEVITEKVTVENGGILDVQAQINTTDFIICAEEMYVDDDENAEGGKSGEVLITDASKINNNANIYFDLKLNAANPAKIANQWHAFCVPFPVDLNAGVTCYQGETPVENSKNEVDYAIMQYQGDVRAQGKYGWIKVHKTGAKELTPGVFYLLTVNEGTTSVRFTKKAGSGLIANPEVTVNPHVISGEGESSDKGWNGVGNPNLFKGNLSNGISNAYILDPISYSYIFYESADFDKLKIAVGTPYFVQNTTDSEQQTAKFIDANNDPVSVSSRLLAKQTEAKSIASQKVYLRRNNTTFRDKLYVSASEDATGNLSDEGNYFKLQRTSTPDVPQIYAISNDTKLAGMRAMLNCDDAEIPLGLYAPQADTYTIFTIPSDEVTIYLAKDGEIIANLTEDDYELSLAKGTTNTYSLRLVRKITDVVTSTNEISTNAAKAEKIIINGVLYIFRDGKVYNAQGIRF